MSDTDGLSLTPTSSRKYGSTNDTEASIDNEILVQFPVTTFKSEAKIYYESAFPLVISFFLQYLLAATPIFIVGHIGAVELGSVSLAIMTFNITGAGLVQGCVTALDTFAAQAYGAQKYHLVGEFCQKAWMLINILSIPVLMTWWFMEPILGFLQPDRQIAMLATQYLRILILGLPAVIIFEVAKRFLQCQKIFDASTKVLFFGAPFGFFISYLLVFKFELGYIGAPIAVVISYWTIAILLIFYVILIDGKQCWGGFCKNALFQDFSSILKLAIPGVIMTEAEYLAFEAMTLASAYFGTVQLANQSILAAIGSLVFQIPFAVSVAIGTRVSQLIGAGDIVNSKKSAGHALRFALVVGSIDCLGVILFSDPLLKVFTNDKNVINACKMIIPILAIEQIYDTVNITFGSILRAMGKQKVGSIFYLSGYYLVALPLVLVLAFVLHLEVFGLWLGLSTTVLFLAISETIYVFRTNWTQIIEEAKERTSVDY
ncbi:hypothetical protein LJB42_002994 [Komagataella kurtzmanii]|nr:hypothetical protein LJB42_002994 [Komagataella kurtzmanii]